MSVENGSSFAPTLLAPSQDSLLKHCPSRISSRILSPVLSTGSQRTLHHALHRFFFFYTEALHNITVSHVKNALSCNIIVLLCPH